MENIHLLQSQYEWPFLKEVAADGGGSAEGEGQQEHLLCDALIGEPFYYRVRIFVESTLCVAGLWWFMGIWNRAVERASFAQSRHLEPKCTRIACVIRDDCESGFAYCPPSTIVSAHGYRFCRIEITRNAPGLCSSCRWEQFVSVWVRTFFLF